MRGVDRAFNALGRLSVTARKVSMIQCLILEKRVLCPTPGRGSVVSMSSYDLTEELEKYRVSVGRVEGANFDANGLNDLIEFMILVVFSIENQFRSSAMYFQNN